MMHVPYRSVLIFIDHFPQSASCKIIRLAKWKREGKKYLEQHTRMFETLFDNVRYEIVGEHSENLYLNLLTRFTTVERVRKAERQCDRDQER
jgi:hypothetical protein